MRDTPGFAATSFLDADGSLLPRERMTDDQRRTFETWLSRTPRVTEEMRSEQTLVSARADARAKETC